MRNYCNLYTSGDDMAAKLGLEHVSFSETVVTASVAYLLNDAISLRAGKEQWQNHC